MDSAVGLPYAVSNWLERERKKKRNILCKKMKDWDSKPISQEQYIVERKNVKQFTIILYMLARSINNLATHADMYSTRQKTGTHV